MRAAALIALALLLPVAATASPTLAVTGVPKNDVLNLRARPDAKSAKVASLPRDTTGIYVDAVAVKGLDWIHVSHNGRSGWARSQFLSYDEGGLPVRLSCSGTEPFWSIEVGFGRADADLAYTQKRQTLALETPLEARGGPNLWSLSALKGRDFLLIEKASCSDGMSDRDYPFRLSARVARDLLSGCCR